jgi:hypothetical protein
MKEKKLGFPNFELPKEELCSPGINFNDYKVKIPNPKINIREVSPGVYDIRITPTGRTNNLVLTRKEIENLISQLESFLQDSETEEAQQNCNYPKIRW